MQTMLSTLPIKKERRKKRFGSEKLSIWNRTKMKLAMGTLPNHIMSTFSLLAFQSLSSCQVLRFVVPVHLLAISVIKNLII